MKIIASKRDEALRRKAEYEKQKEAYNADMNEREQRRLNDEMDIIQPIKDKIEQDLSQFDLLDFDVRVSRGWSLNRRGENNPSFVEILIRCNEMNKSDDNVALSWSYEVGLNRDGQVESETSSWSGLKATTSAQLDSLRQTLSALELLNSYDWESLILVEFPEYMSYFKDAPEAPEKFNSRNELAMATMEDMIGDGNKAIRVRGWSEEYPGEYWVIVKGMTEKQWRLQIISDFLIRGLKNPETLDQDNLTRYIATLQDDIQNGGWSVRARKVNVIPNEPPEIVDLDELIAEASKNLQ